MFAQNAIGFWSASESYDADLVTYMTGLSTPLSTGQKDLLNTFILALKSGLSITNLSDAFDVMYILAGETEESSLRNLVKREYDATAVNSPTFVKYEGYNGNGVTSFLNTNWNPTEKGIRFKQNTASLGLYIRNDDNYTNVMSNGASDGTYVNGIRLCPRYGSNNYAYAAINDTQSNVASTAQNSIGFYILNRSASNSTNLFKNDSNIIISSSKSDGITSYDLYIGAYNNAGTTTGFESHQYSFYFLGKDFTLDECNIIKGAIETYMDANGKGVIT